jgi:DNA-binding NarL/FixJ family response regulator
MNFCAERPQETMTMKPIRVLIADDNKVLRTFFREYLERQEGFELVGEACDGVEVVRLTQACGPDVVVMDISMPHKDGLAATADLAREFPQVRVIVMSSHDDAACVQEAIGAGAVGYLVKAGSVRLEVAITAVANGQTYFDPIISRHVPDHARKQRSTVPFPTRQNPESDVR